MGKEVIRKYSCQNCGGSVFKYASCHIEKDEDGNKKDYAGLSGWHCDKGCKPCKVKVELVEQ